MWLLYKYIHIQEKYQSLQPWNRTAASSSKSELHNRQDIPRYIITSKQVARRQFCFRYYYTIIVVYYYMELGQQDNFFSFPCVSGLWPDFHSQSQADKEGGGKILAIWRFGSRDDGTILDSPSI
jgi:hypothetical protein